MRTASDEFQEYLAPDESVIESGAGALLENAYRTEGSIGVTDRRVLFVSDGDEFMGITQDGIHSIRSRPETMFATHDTGYRLVAVAGAVLAVLAFVGVLGLGPSGLAPALALATVGGLAGAEYVRRNGVGTERAVLTELDERLSTHLDVELLRAHVGDTRDVDGQQLLVLGVGLVALTAFAGLVAVTANLLTIPLTLVTLGGIAVMEYAYRCGRDAQRLERDRPAEKRVSIRLASGQIVDLRVDSAERIDRTLSRVAAERAHENTATTLSHP